jgi:hypothetical protein
MYSTFPVSPPVPTTRRRDGNLIQIFLFRYYQVIMMIDIFQYSNMYTCKPAIQRKSKDRSVAEECGVYVTREGRCSVHIILSCALKILIPTSRTRLPDPIMARTRHLVLSTETWSDGARLDGDERSPSERDRCKTIRHVRDHQGFPSTSPSLAHLRRYGHRSRKRRETIPIEREGEDR